MTNSKKAQTAPGNPKITTKMRNRAFLKKEQGNSNREIAKILKISHTAVNALFREQS